MNKYTRHDKDFDIPAGLRIIIGFQQVLTDDTKVHVWMREKVERPSYIDRHRTTREANHTQRKIEWGKSVWLKSEVIKHLGSSLKKLNITAEHFHNLSDDKLSDKWVTNGDGNRNFLKALIVMPISDISGKPFRIQVTQYKGQAPEGVYTRAHEEYLKGLGKYDELLQKYKDRALVKSYIKTASLTKGKYTSSRELKEVYVQEESIKYPVYEESDIVLGEPHHIFIEYTIPNELPIDIIPESNYNQITTTLRTSEDEIEKVEEEKLEMVKN